MIFYQYFEDCSPPIIVPMVCCGGQRMGSKIPAFFYLVALNPEHVRLAAESAINKRT
jgi:hypothetical protein